MWTIYLGISRILHSRGFAITTATWSLFIGVPCEIRIIFKISSPSPTTRHTHTQIHTASKFAGALTDYNALRASGLPLNSPHSWTSVSTCCWHKSSTSLHHSSTVLWWLQGTWHTETLYIMQHLVYMQILTSRSPVPRKSTAGLNGLA